MFHEVGKARIETTIGAMKKAAANRRPILLLNDIRDLAHKKWVDAGRPQGDCTRFWQEAELEIQEVR
jgi:hypothetical protein